MFILRWYKTLKYKLRLLPYQPKIFWYRLWIRKDEFHRSLSSCIDYQLILNDDDRAKFRNDVERRRRIAHERDMNRR